MVILMDFIKVHGKFLFMNKLFKCMIGTMQLNINISKSCCLVCNSKLNQRVLKILHINGYIEGFRLINSQYILVNFKFKNNKNVINRLVRFNINHNNQGKFFKIRNNVELQNFMIFSARKGLHTNRDWFLDEYNKGFPILGVI